MNEAQKLKNNEVIYNKNKPSLCFSRTSTSVGIETNTLDKRSKVRSTYVQNEEKSFRHGHDKREQF